VEGSAAAKRLKNTGLDCYQYRNNTIIVFATTHGRRKDFFRVGGTSGFFLNFFRGTKSGGI